MLYVAVLFLGCGGPSDDGSSPPPSPQPATADTAASTTDTIDTAEVIDGLCTATGNALRFTCPGSGSFRWWPQGEPERARAVDADGEALIWGVPVGTPTIVELPDGTRTVVEPGALPQRLLGMRAEATGSGQTRAVALPNPCEGKDLVVLDGLGRLIWYEELQAPVAAIDATPTQTFLVLVGGSRVLELDMTGDGLLNVADFERPLHHDLTRDEAGYTYVLNAEAFPWDGTDYVLDGLYVIAPDGTTTTWDLFDHIDPAILDPSPRGYYWAGRFPGAVDFSHGNSVEASADGGLTLSFRWMNAAIHLVGDPTDPSFGEVDWVLSSQGDLPTDFALVGPDPAFDGQHHVSVAADGTVWMFDNGIDDEPSRGIRFALGSDEATELDAWRLERHCAIQGSAYPTDDEGVLLTCSQSGEVREFGPASLTPRWQLDVACDTGPRTLLNRVVPVDW